ncbi:hypothetical protein FPV67DRAFT_1671222 [Lyophyllum atratum]|nr:hypothetical protein FPV67DRAFT_1671222 [Lyophyllum atratum]
MTQTVVVTGASGFIGSHIVVQLLDEGYRVRGLARGSKVAELAKTYARFGDNFEAVTISDIATNQFPEALSGADALIHSGTPIAGRQSPEAVLKTSIEGTLNVLRQAERAGIKRIVVTSSISTAITPERTFTDQDWHSATMETALSGTYIDAYYAAKTLAEREVWSFADVNPHLDITTLNPPFVYGPFARGFSLPTPNYAALSSNLLLYAFLNPAGKFPGTAAQIDVRDLAKAHVLALRSPPTSQVGRKRIMLASPYNFDFKTIIDVIAEKRPDLRGRLLKPPAKDLPFKRAPVNFERILQVIGIRKDEFRLVEETIVDAIDSLILLEKRWIADGHSVTIPVGS